jgi:hypothetical protein
MFIGTPELRTLRRRALARRVMAGPFQAIADRVGISFRAASIYGWMKAILLTVSCRGEE